MCFWLSFFLQFRLSSERGEEFAEAGEGGFEFSALFALLFDDVGGGF